MSIHSRSILLLGPRSILPMVALRDWFAVLASRPLDLDEAADIADSIVHWLPLGDGRVVDVHEKLERRPLRAPHYTVSRDGLCGSRTGGRYRHGEVRLARHGVLYLDDVLEFPLAALGAAAAQWRKQPGHVIAYASPCGGGRDCASTCVCSPALLEVVERRVARIRTEFDVVERVATHIEMLRALGFWSNVWTRSAFEPAAQRSGRPTPAP